MKRFNCFLLFLSLIIVSCSVEKSKPVEIEREIELAHIDTSEVFSWKGKDEFFKPFLYGYSYNDDIKNKTILKDSSQFHPLSIGRHAFFCLYMGYNQQDSGMLQLGKEYLDFLVDYPYTKETESTIVYLYPFNHHELKANNWWSAMANSSISLAFRLGAEIFDNDHYQKLADRSLNGMCYPISKGGSSLVLDSNKVWFLEYADDTRTEDNSYFVLNGYLYALLGVKASYLITKNPALLKQYHSGLRAFNELSNRFFYKGDEWTYYMLKPLTIEPPHYNIFDLLLFKALNSHSPEPFIEEEIERRRKIIQMQYPISKINQGDSVAYFFSVIGPPHPYWLDIYPPIINYFDSEGNTVLSKKLTLPKDFTKPISERSFNSDTFRKGVVFSAELVMDYGSHKQLLYQVKENELSVLRNDSHVVIKPSFLLDSDKVKSPYFEKKIGSKDELGEEIEVMKISSSFTTPIDLDKYKYFGFEINVDSERPISYRTFLRDIDGKSINRYNILPKQDTNSLILYNKLGFKGLDGFNEKEVKSIEFNFYYKVKDKPRTVNLDFDELLLFENEYQLKAYFDTHSFFYPEEGRKGNIY